MPILVFPYQTVWHYSVADHRNGRVKSRGYEKIVTFQPVSRFISEMIQGRAIVTLEGKWETIPKFSNGTSLSDLE